MSSTATSRRTPLARAAATNSEIHPTSMISKPPPSTSAATNSYPTNASANSLPNSSKPPLSQGTLANIVKRGSPKAASALAPIKEALIASPVGHADETGCTLHGQRHWLHVFGTEELTLYHLDAKRGREAMDRMGILPNFRGLLIHDCLGAYFTNNRAEQDVRMMKVREMISGTFRSAEHGKGFCELCSIISSATKQGRGILKTLAD